MSTYRSRRKPRPRMSSFPCNLFIPRSKFVNSLLNVVLQPGAPISVPKMNYVFNLLEFLARRCAHIGLDGEAVPKCILFVVTLSILLLKSSLLFHKTLGHTVRASSYRWRVFDQTGSSYFEKDAHMSVSTEKPARNLFMVMYIRQGSFLNNAFRPKKLSAKPRVDPAIDGSFLTRGSRVMDKRKYAHRSWRRNMSAGFVERLFSLHGQFKSDSLPQKHAVRLRDSNAPPFLPTAYVGWWRYS